MCLIFKGLLTRLFCGRVSLRNMTRNKTSTRARIRANMAGAWKNMLSWRRACLEKNAPIRGPMMKPIENATPIAACQW